MILNVKHERTFIYIYTIYNNFSLSLSPLIGMGIAGNPTVHIINNLVLPHKGVADSDRRSIIINSHYSRNLATINKVNLV